MTLTVTITISECTVFNVLSMHNLFTAVLLYIVIVTSSFMNDVNYQYITYIINTEQYNAYTS